MLNVEQKKQQKKKHNKCLTGEENPGTARRRAKKGQANLMDKSITLISSDLMQGFIALLRRLRDLL
jgi:hypothetical protein